MTDCRENVKNDFLLDVSFSEMSITTYEDIIQKSFNSKRKEDILKQIFNERQQRREFIKPGPPIYFNSDEDGIVNFYDDLTDYIIRRKRQSLFIYKTFMRSLEIYCTQKNTQNYDIFYTNFSNKWLKDVGRIREYLNHCNLSCDEKNLVYETIVLLHLYITSINLKNFDLNTIINLLWCIYFNSQDDRVVSFLNITICDEFFISIPCIVVAIYKGMNFQSVPLDVENYSIFGMNNFRTNQNSDNDSVLSSFNKNSKPIIRGKRRCKTINRNNNNHSEEEFNIKKDRRKKLEELLLTCGDESLSRYSCSHLLKILDEKKRKKVKIYKESLPTDFKNLLDDTKKIGPELSFFSSENYLSNKDKGKVLVPGTPERIINKSDSHHETKQVFNSPSSTNNNNINCNTFTPYKDSDNINKLFLKTPESDYFEEDINKEIWKNKKRKICNIVLETPPHKINCRKVSKELNKISDLAKLNSS
uniref:Formin 2 n=1 Tax=Strongyloides stercoralis TaxID=6248 RepID=A0A0K0DT83_STRER